MYIKPDTKHLTAGIPFLGKPDIPYTILYVDPKFKMLASLLCFGYQSFCSSWTYITAVQVTWHIGAAPRPAVTAGRQLPPRQCSRSCSALSTAPTAQERASAR